MEQHEDIFPNKNSAEQAKKNRIFEVQLPEGRKLELREGSIADSNEEALFVLNLSDTKFPEPGPVFESIYDKDEELKEKNEAHGKKIWDIMKEAVPSIPDATVSQEEDLFSGLKYNKATFPSQPYNVMDLDVTEANWPHLKKIYFGNIGPSGEGTLVRIWQPITRQEPKLREELTTLLNNLIDKLETNSDIKSIAMPILTGNRANSSYFYEVLSEVCKARKVPADLVIYAFKSEDYEEGVKVMQNLSEQFKFSEIPQEHIPTPEEVNSVFKELIKKEYTEVRKREDEKGLYLLEVTTQGELEGEMIEYAYMRKGRYSEGESSENEIHVTYYKNDIPISGTSAARFINGHWKIL